MTTEHKPHQELLVFGAAIALANEIESAEKELLDSGWGGYPWEHLGDASRDVAKLIRGLREANGLIEQLEAAHAEIDGLNERIELRADEDSIYRVYDAEVERRQRVETALRDIVEWADDQQAATGSESVTSLFLRFDRARDALRSHSVGES